MKPSWINNSLVNPQKTMYKITLLLIPLILLSSCTIDWNDEKDAKIAELEKQITELKQKNDDELFKNKQKCLEIYRKLDTNSALMRDTRDIFYSNDKSTCILVWDSWDEGKRNFTIFDILSMHGLYWFRVDKDWNIVGRNNLSWELNELKCWFNEALSKLKWEDSVYFNSAKDCVDWSID